LSFAVLENKVKHLRKKERSSSNYSNQCWSI